jgi:transcriptional regulator with PAS, ATPase and Fis domain
MREGQFREDLYYRLNVITLTLPPLAQRREDVAPMASQFLQRWPPSTARPCAASRPTRWKR